MKQFIWMIGLAVVVASCAGNRSDGPEKSVEEIRSEGLISNSDIIRNPVSANEPMDTVNVAKIAFAETSFDFGEAKEGEVITKVFQFTNTGKVPLIISNARSTCGCTVPDWPKDPVAPGEQGEITVKFDTANKKGPQNKPVTITANTYPASTKVFLQGTVINAENDKQQTAVTN